MKFHKSTNKYLKNTQYINYTTLLRESAQKNAGQRG